MQKTLLFFFIFLHSFVLKAQTIHAILIADTNDNHIGVGCAMSLANMTNFVNLLERKKIVARVNFYKFSGDRFKKETIEAEIRNVSCQEDDIILFFYAGHGFRTMKQKFKYPCLFAGSRLNNDSPSEVGISSETVYKQLQAKNPKLLLMFIDACNTEAPGTEAIKGELIHNAGIPSQSTDSKYSKLFLESKGCIIASSSLPNTDSWVADEGGFFGLGLYDALSYTAYSNESPAGFWQVIMNTASKLTIDNFNRYNSDKNIKQVPQFEGTINGQAITSNSFIESGRGEASSSLEQQINGLLGKKSWEEKKKITANLTSEFSALTDGSDANVKIITPSGISAEEAKKHFDFLRTGSIYKKAIIKEVVRGKNNKIIKLTIKYEK